MKFKKALVLSVFLLSFLLLMACRGEKLTDQERSVIQGTFIPDLEAQKENLMQRMNFRSSFNGLNDQIGSAGPETFAQRYQSSINICDAWINAFKKELESGRKIAPPMQPAGTRSQYKQYFKE